MRAVIGILVQFPHWFLAGVAMNCSCTTTGARDGFTAQRNTTVMGKSFTSITADDMLGC